MKTIKAFPAFLVRFVNLWSIRFHSLTTSTDIAGNVASMEQAVTSDVYRRQF